MCVSDVSNSPGMLHRSPAGTPSSPGFLRRVPPREREAPSSKPGRPLLIPYSRAQYRIPALRLVSSARRLMSGKSGKLNSFQMTFYTGPIAFATLASGGDLGKFWGDSGEILGSSSHMRGAPLEQRERALELPSGLPVDTVRLHHPSSTSPQPPHTSPISRSYRSPSSPSSTSSSRASPTSRSRRSASCSAAAAWPWSTM